MGPFLRHPTPNNGKPARLSSKLIVVAVSTIAAAAASTLAAGGRRRAIATSTHTATIPRGILSIIASALSSYSIPYKGRVNIMKSKRINC